jgi:lipid A 3-O-deacylase
MHQYCWGVAVAAACLLSSAAYAGGSPINELRLGIYQHDTGIIGTHKEEGADFALEALTRPVTALWLIGSPRIVFGGAYNTAGQTSQIYLGIDKQLDFLHNTFSSSDAFFIEGTIGGVWQDGKHDVVGTPLEARWKSHGGSFLFRPGLALGYRFNQTWSIAASLNHISNAGLGNPNEGMNDLGLLIGMKL